MEQDNSFILIKVHGLYQKYGIKSITMDDVAREIGMSKKTLYQHFKDKNELVAKTLYFALDHFMSKVYQIKDKQLNAIDELIEINQLVNNTIEKHTSHAIDYDLRKYHPEIYDKFIVVKRQKIHESVIQNMNKGIEEGMYREQMNTEIISRFYIERIDNMVDMEFYQLENYTFQYILKEIFEYHIRGIASQKGIDYFERIMNENKTLVQ